MSHGLRDGAFCAWGKAWISFVLEQDPPEPVFCIEILGALGVSSVRNEPVTGGDTYGSGVMI